MKKNNKKVFIYMNKDFPLDANNIFISGLYSSEKSFKKLNPQFTPLLAYEADRLIDFLLEQKFNGSGEGK